MKTKILLGGILLSLLATSAYSVRVENDSVTLLQPNGDTVTCLVTGDEYYHWLHDEADFTIVRNDSGYWAYAEKIDDILQASAYIVDKVDPSSVGLVPGVRKSVEDYYERYKVVSDPVTAATPTIGTINQLCIFIRFSGEDEFTGTRAEFDSAFNYTATGYTSVRNYYDEVSYGQLTINTTFYPSTAPSTNLSFEDSHSRGYFQPYDQYTNTIGYIYDSAGDERRRQLLRDAIAGVSGDIPSYLDVDADDDGVVDLICFIVHGEADSWGNVLWSHRSSLWDAQEINSAEVSDYTFVMESQTVGIAGDVRIGTICHEMFHGLGGPDLYHYSHDGMGPVGIWDIMAGPLSPPQHMGSYMKDVYTGWTSVPTASGGGVYTLNTLTSPSGHALKFINNDAWTEGEYFIVEHRQQEPPFESSLIGAGLLIYRINNNVVGSGNAGGPPDEVYIYRPGGTSTENGFPHLANFGYELGRYYFDDFSDPYCLLTSANKGHFLVADISRTDDPSGLMSFYASPNPEYLAGSLTGTLAALSYSNAYCAFGDITTASGQTLTVGNGAIYYSHRNVLHTADGTIQFQSGSQWTHFFNLGGYRTGIRAKGGIRLTNGGQIGFR